MTMRGALSSRVRKRRVHPGSWVSVPVNMIEKIDLLGTIPCRDHQHHHARINLREPPAENRLARVLYDLLRHPGRLSRNTWTRRRSEDEMERRCFGGYFA